MAELYQHSASFHMELKMVDLPKCPKCRGNGDGEMLPLYDQLQDGGIVVKSWVCNNCLHNITLRSGNLVDIRGNKM